MRTVNVLLSLLVSAILALVVFEVGLRLIGMGPPDTGLDHDSYLGWSKVPDHELHRKTSEYDVTIGTNTWGLRGEQLEQKANPAGNFRILALGDSFTLGFTVAKDDLFTEQLQRWWQSENRRVDVINAGTQGYSTDQAVLWAERNAADFAPNLVMLFPYENDIYWNGQGTYQRSPKPLYRADGTLETGQLEKPPGRGLVGNTAIGRLFEDKEGLATFVPEGGQKEILREFAPLLSSPPAFLADAEARTRGALIALQRTCQELGAKLVVAPIPSHSAVDPTFASTRFGPKVLELPDAAWDPNRPVDFFLGLCGELSIETLDVRKTLRDRIAGGEQLYYKRDWHLNPSGNAVLAGFLHDGLDGLGVFPAENSATRTSSLPAVPAVPAGFPGWLKLYLLLWVVLSVIYARTYPEDPAWKGPLGVAGMLGLVFAIVLGGTALLDNLQPRYAQAIGIVFVIGLLGFVAYKLGRRIGTIAELMKAFTLRGHWYLMPLVVVLLTIGSLLVVAASSPLIAPFIYTLF